MNPTLSFPQPAPLDPRLVEALARHESLLQAGRDVPAEDLCADQPELLEPLRLALQQMRVFRQRFQGDTIAEDAGLAKHPSPPGYSVQRELGVGGMGVVYLARQTGLDRPVALKMIRSGALAGATEVARFVIEAQVLAQLRHPHIVQIIEIGQHEAQPYFSMEFCPGGALAQRLEGTPLPAAHAAHLVEQLADAVAHAHGQGILHRDLKPANILLAAEGAPKITDFGLAQRLDADSGLTRTGAIQGTPAYMAPEQARGEKGLTVAVDIWALGALLYECLTGRPPFKGTSVGETLDQVRTREPVGPRQLNPSVPRDLETICLKCLRKEPGRRYDTAQELADDLGRFQRGEPIRARAVGRVERFCLWTWRNPVLAGVTVLASVALLAALAVSVAFAIVKSWDAATLSRTAGALAEEVQRKETALATAENRQGELERMLLTASLRRVGSLWRENPVEARQILANPLQCPPRMHDFAWGYLSRLTADSWREIAAEPQAIRGVAWLPGGERIIAVTRSQFGDQKPGALRVWEARTGKLVGSFADTPRYLTTLAVASEGRTIVTGGNDDAIRAQIIIWDIGTWRAVRKFSYPARFVRALAVSRTGRFVVAGMDNGAVVLWDLDHPDAAPWSKPAHTSLVWGVAVTEDGQFVASCSPAAGSLIVHDRRQDRTISSVDRNNRPRRVVFADSDQVVIAGLDGLRSWLFREQPKPVADQGRLVTALQSLDRSLDSDHFVAAGSDRTIRVLNIDGKLEASLPRGSIEDHAALSPDGQRVAIGTFDGKILLWDWAGLTTRGLLLSGTPRLLTGVEGRLGILSGGWFSEIDAQRARLRWSGRAALTKLTDAVFLSGSGAPLLALSQTAEQSLQWWNLAQDDPPRGAPRVPVWSLPLEKAAQWLVVDPLETFAVLGGYSGYIQGEPRTGWLQVVSLPEGTPGQRWTKTDHMLTSLALAPDGRFLLTGWTTTPLGGNEHRDGLVELRERESGTVLKAITIPKSGVVVVTFSADSRWAAWAEETGQITVWDCTAGRPAATLRGHRGQVRALAFSPDGRQLASGGVFGSWAGEIRLWQVPTWQEEAVIEMEPRFDLGLGRKVEGAVRSLRFLASGKILAVATDDSQIRFLSAEPLDGPAP